MNNADIEKIEQAKAYLASLRPVYERDMLKFGREVLGYDRLSYDVHQPIIDMALKEDSGLFLIPRDHLKTTLLTITGSIFSIIHNQDVRIYISNAVLGMSVKFLREIKDQLQNNALLKALWPEVFYINPEKEAPKWTEEEITVKRKKNRKESTITIGSVGNMAIGSHFDLHIYDDIVLFQTISVFGPFHLY